MDERENFVEEVKLEETKDINVGANTEKTKMETATTESVKAETRQKRKKWKKRKRYRVLRRMVVGLTIIVLVSVTAIFYKKNRDLSRDYNTLAEEKDNIIEMEVREQLANAENAKVFEMKELFKNGLSEGSAIKFLREEYGDTHLVYQLGNKYLFRPILDVEMADYSNGEFVVDEETGLRAFSVNGERVTKHVVDVSKYQGEIDWKAVKEFGIDGAMIRAGVRGYGSGEIVADATFEANIKAALENDLSVGVYFFSEAVTVEEAEEEAQFVIDALKPYKTQLPVVIDLEEIEGDDARNEALSKEELTEVALAFMEKIEEAGYEAMLYGNITTISEMVDYTRLQDYGLWFAYYSDDIYVPYKVDMWQYSSSGKVPGIDTDCDLNMMFSEE